MVVPDHPGASGPSDRAYAERVIHAAALGREPVGAEIGNPCARTLFTDSSAMATDDLDESDLHALLGGEVLDIERSPDGATWALTGAGAQVVTRAKEAAVLRPHGIIMRSGDALTPDTGTLTSTVWMGGTFASQLTRGEASRRPLVTLRRTYLEVLAAHGVRIFVRPAGSDADAGVGAGAEVRSWQLLGRPSAWRVTPDSCTWVYAAEGRRVDVSAGCRATPHEAWLDLTVREGPELDVLVAVAIDPGEAGVDVAAEQATVVLRQRDPSGAAWRLETAAGGCGPAPLIGADEVLWRDGRGRGTPWLTATYAATRAVALRLTATAVHAVEQVAPAEDARVGDGFTGWLNTAVTLAVDASEPEDAQRAWSALALSLPWLAHDALVHYLSPRGLEQYTGGAWGTRDVCQGPVGLLSALDRPAELRDVLLRVFRDQNARGDWPQAFDFLPPLRERGQVDSHGDVVHWPLLAAGDYLQATGDASLLAAQVSLVGEHGPTRPVSVAEHVRRAVAAVEDGMVRGGAWPAYGHGDWNDALQPVDPSLARRMVSTWTAVLQVQGMRSLAAGLRAAAAEAGLADRAERIASRTADAIAGLLAAEPVLAGYLLLEDGAVRERLVRPGDLRTGLDYGILPWIHAITADLLTPEQARQHLALIGAHLTGPDGARLFNRPVHYSGGPMSIFQRAEASTFWGREIGLMYVHAHLRWAEALARVGDGPGLLRALALATPLGASRLVVAARPRQTTTYASSSDGVFADRADAEARYADLLAGRVPLEGGWRTYSSGPGLLLRLLVECLLGVRRRAVRLEIDPVLDPALGEVRARLPLDGRLVDLVLRPGSLGHGVLSVHVGEHELATAPLTNPYRPAGVSVGLAAVRSAAAGTAHPILVLTR
ncbi:MAG: cellobiose phosphorylase [Tetrasphaera sp.]